MRKLNWSGPSRMDLLKINDWLSREATPEVAASTLSAIRKRVNSLVDFPHGGRAEIDCDFRVLRVHKTPYLIVYRVMDDGLQILRVRHERENWQTSP